jgi:transcriptional regulator with XRE-family HTH domain
MSLPKLKSMREARGFTQRDLAHVSGVSISAISRAETGSQITKSDALLKLADALQVSTDSLLGREAPTNNQAQTLAAER